MKNYIGSKIIKAKPMNHKDFMEKQGLQGSDQEGYHVEYPDGYTSWSPKEVFEGAYREISTQEMALINPIRTEQE